MDRCVCGEWVYAGGGVEYVLGVERFLCGLLLFVQKEKKKEKRKKNNPHPILSLIYIYLFSFILLFPTLLYTHSGFPVS